MVQCEPHGHFEPDWPLTEFCHPERSEGPHNLRAAHNFSSVIHKLVGGPSFRAGLALPARLEMTMLDCSSYLRQSPSLHFVPDQRGRFALDHRMIDLARFDIKFIDDDLHKCCGGDGQNCA